MKKILLIATIILSIVFAGCVFNEKKRHGVNFVYSSISSIGYSGNQTDLQEIKWRINITNTGYRTAESTNASVILHPEIVSRLTDSSLSLVMLGNLSASTRAEFNGMAVFNVTGLSKQDIA